MEPRVEKYWPIRCDLTMIDCIAMKGKHKSVVGLLQKQILEQLHSNHVGIEETCLLVRESIYWANMNIEIEQVVKQCSIDLEYQHTQPCDVALHYDIPCKPCEVVGADVCMINNRNLTCIVDYYSKFTVVKRWQAFQCRTWCKQSI